jgi:hypothetical protein
LVDVEIEKAYADDDVKKALIFAVVQWNNLYFSILFLFQFTKLC